jgi:hypothetical protein
VSLWHKIFDPPAEQATKFTEEVADREVVEVEETFDEQKTSWADEERNHRAESPADAESRGNDFESDADGGGPTEESEQGESRQRGRRRRRGRGGRGSEDEDRSGESRSGGGRRGEGRSDREPSGRRAPHRSRGPVSNHGNDDDFDDLGVEQDDEELANGHMLGDDLGDEDSLDEADGDSNGRADGRGHRSIPSWDEAIGMIVDANMQSRSQRRPPSHSGARGGSSRGGRPRGGRSRGGRRRPKPPNGE